MAKENSATPKTAKPKTAKAPKPKKPSVSEMLEEAADILKRIEKQEKVCQSARLDVDDARETYKMKKGTYQAECDALHKLCRLRDEKHPLFDAAAKKNKKPAAPGVDGLPPDAVRTETILLKENVNAPPAIQHGAGETVTAFVAADGTIFLFGKKPNGEAVRFDVPAEWFTVVVSEVAMAPWRDTPVVKLLTGNNGVTEKHVKALEAAGIGTCGKLGDLMDRAATWWDKEVRGISASNKAAVEDALADLRANSETPA